MGTLTYLGTSYGHQDATGSRWLRAFGALVEYASFPPMIIGNRRKISNNLISKKSIGYEKVRGLLASAGHFALWFPGADLTGRHH